MRKIPKDVNYSSRREHSTICRQVRSSTPSTAFGAHAILRERQKKHASVCFLGPICLTWVILNVCGHWWPSGYGWPANDGTPGSTATSAKGESAGRSVAMNVSFMWTKSCVAAGGGGGGGAGGWKRVDAGDWKRDDTGDWNREGGGAADSARRYPREDSG